AVDSVDSLSTGSSAGYAAVKWYRIDATTGLLLESGLITDAHHEYLYPSIAVNAFGEVVIGYTRAGDSTTLDFAGSYASTGIFDGVTTTFNAPMLLKAGVGNYSIVSGGRNRWGDFSATTINPDNPFDF